MTAAAIDSARSQMRFITCGSVDDGKSTLIGRLLNDASALLDDQVVSLKRDSRRFGTAGDAPDYALLLDGLEAEREQGITIDVAYRFFSTAKRAFVVADTPGHAQYTRNMATGASNADLAVLLIDARRGVAEQTRRHAAIVSLLGVRHVVLAVNKMDLVDFAEDRFDALVADFTRFARRLSFATITAVPLSARHGDNVAEPSANMPWHSGPTLLSLLETIEIAESEAAQPFRMTVQWINRPNQEFRGVSGRIASGELRVGQELVVAGSGRSARVARIVTFDGDLAGARAGRSVTLVLDADIDVARGDLLTTPKQRAIVTRRFSAEVVWLDDAPAQPGGSYLLKTGAATTPVTLSKIQDVLSIETLERAPPQVFALNAVGRLDFETADPVAIDAYAENRRTGAFILIDRATHRTAAAGMVVEDLSVGGDVHAHGATVSPAARAATAAQTPCVVWLTGLSGSGKSTIANLVERRLVDLGRHTMLLDGDNLRQGLNADLGFDETSRTENVRRVGEVAKLLHDAGLIVIAALVSPFRADRARVASLLPPGRFFEVFVDAPIEICRERDPKGLYAKAEAGKIVNFTGRDQAYETPLAPALWLKTDQLSADEAADQILQYVIDGDQLRPPPSG